MKTINYTNTQNKFSQFVWKCVKNVGIPLLTFLLFTNTIIVIDTHIRNKHIACYNAFFTPPTTASQEAKNYEIRYNFAQKFRKHFSQEERNLITNGNLTGNLKSRVFKFIKEKHVERIIAIKKCAYYDAFFKTPISMEQEEQFFKTRCAFVKAFENEFTDEEKELITIRDVRGPLCDKVFKLIQNKFVELP